MSESRKKATKDMFAARYAVLLARRVPLDAVQTGRAYVIHARSGGVGVADREDGRIGHYLRRENGGNYDVFAEMDWTDGPPLGTAIPLVAIDAEPPKDDEHLLAWLADRETEHMALIDAAWRVVQGDAASLDPMPEPQRRGMSFAEVEAEMARRYAILLAHRIPVDAIVVGRAYVVHAKDGGVGVALREHDRLGYQIHRAKFGDELLEVHWDWSERPGYGICQRI